MSCTTQFFHSCLTDAPLERYQKQGVKALFSVAYKTMTEQQEKFAIEYARTGNATQSAISAGYSEESARKQGSRLLTNEDIRKKVDEVKAQMAEELRNKMAKEASTAFDVLVKIMNNQSAKDADRIKCAIDLLDRAGYVAEKKVDVSVAKADMDKMDYLLKQYGMLND